ncbi:MAG: 3-phosphoshikimate 1-carboxyvinyltransferase [bacterium]
MKHITIHRTPGDKSITHRAIILGSLAEGRTSISNYLASEDCIATRTAFEAMGVKIRDTHASTIEIEGAGLPGLRKPEAALDAQNSGTTMRLLSGVLAGQAFDSVLTGDQYLRKRPMKRVLVPLQSMGAEIEAEDGGTAPLTIRGGRTLTGIEYRLPVASAQVKSALLLAGLYAGGNTTVIEPVPTRDHTERMLQGFGVKVVKADKKITISGDNRLTGCDVTVPADFSSAAFWIVTGLLLPGLAITMKGIGINPTRTGLLTVLNRMGARIRFINERKESEEPVADLEIDSSNLTGTTVSGEIIPLLIDEIPILALAAAFAKGTTVIKDAAELRVKETDRIKAMTAELSKLGVEVEEKPDGMIIQGRGHLSRPSRPLENYGDHRIAMCLAVAGFCAFGDEHLVNCDCIDTSYPKADFFAVFDQLRSR